MLINCPACNKEVSATAKSCIGCGHPLVEKPNLTRHIRNIAIGAILAIVVTIILHATGVWGLSSAERYALNDIRLVQGMLLDPNSMVLHEVYAIRRYYTTFRGDEIDIQRTYIRFASRNRAGGLTPSTAIVDDGQVRLRGEGSEVDAAATNLNIVQTELQIAAYRSPLLFVESGWEVRSIEHERLQRRLN